MDKNALLYRILYGVGVLLLLVVVTLVYSNGYPMLGGIALLITVATAYIFGSNRAYSYRYLYPSLLAFGIFVITPLVYTVFIAFTNYSDNHRQSETEIRKLLLTQRDVDVEQNYSFSLYRVENGKYQLFLKSDSPQDFFDTSESRAEESVSKYASFLTESFKMPSAKVKDAVVVSAEFGNLAMEGESVSLKDLINLQDQLAGIEIAVSDDLTLVLTSLKSFAPVTYLWRAGNEGNTLISAVDGRVITPHKSGYFLDKEGKRHGPGFQAMVGAKNFIEIFSNPDIRRPFLKVFIWTISFAVLTVISIFVLGFVLAVILQAPSLKGRSVWRTLLIIPYAVPAFISILIFKGLFNPQFGEINIMLTGIFGITNPPDWFTNPMFARAMILLVNLWLGYPYMMIVCMGILQSIPSDIYEASAIDNGNPVSDALKLTLPLILPPLKPLLITIFAFNFNNFLLVNLLTNGAPQMAGAGLVGETDLLVTYTYNLAFMSGNNYALASAISVIIFIIVGSLSYLNLKMTVHSEEE